MKKIIFLMLVVMGIARIEAAAQEQLNQQRQQNLKADEAIEWARSKYGENLGDALDYPTSFNQLITSLESIKTKFGFTIAEKVADRFIYRLADELNVPNSQQIPLQHMPHVLLDTFLNLPYRLQDKITQLENLEQLYEFMNKGTSEEIELWINHLKAAKAREEKEKQEDHYTYRQNQ